MSALDEPDLDLRSGGVRDVRSVDDEDAFEAMLERRLGPLVREDDGAAARLWSSLTNTIWRHATGRPILYSFRAAGDVVAALRGEGDYLDWYCCGPWGAVDGEIAGILASEGWASRPALWTAP